MARRVVGNVIDAGAHDDSPELARGRQTPSTSGPGPHSGPGHPALTVSGVRKTFESTEVLHGIDLEIADGAFATVLGPSGSGKTTLLRIIAGFESVDTGAVMLGGKDVTSRAPRQRDLGMVFQSYALFPHLTVEDNIAYPLRVRKMSSAERRSRVRDYAKRVQLEAYLTRYPHELSGGQQQRVALARALVFQPRLLLLDEPLGALDKRLRMDIQGQLKELHREIGITFIHVTHDQAEAFALSTTVVVMRDGLIEQEGSPEELYHFPASLFVADFIGSANVVRCRVTERGAGLVTAVLADGVRVQVAEDQVDPTIGVDDEAVIVFRAEAGSVVDEGNGVPPDSHLSLRGRVKETTYLGNTYELVLENEHYQPRVHHHRPVAIGETVRGAWPVDGCRVVPRPADGAQQ